MRIIKPKPYTVYKFNELSESAQENAIQELYDINIHEDWYEYTYEDAKAIGLKIDSFDIDRGSYCKMTYLTTPELTAKAIIMNHGETCETYSLAKDFREAIIGMDIESEEFEDACTDFLKDLQEEYLSILRREYEYLTSEDAIINTIVANEYEFTEDGKLN